MSEFRCEKRYSLESISTVSIINPIGRIEVIGWNEDDLLIESTVKCLSDKPSEEDYLPVVKKVDETLLIRVHEPGKPRLSKEVMTELDINISSDEVKNGDFGLQEFVGNIVKMATESLTKVTKGMNASLVIHLPNSMNLNVKNLNGVINISNMNSEVRAKGINGPVSLSKIEGQVIASAVNGPVSLEKSCCNNIMMKSVNGPVKCYLDSVSGDVTLKSVNGPIRCSMPETSDVDLMAKTMHGAIKISSDFKQKARSTHKVQSTLNNGKHSIKIKTSTGAITVVTTELRQDSATCVQAPAPPAVPVPPKPPKPPVPPLAPVDRIEKPVTPINPIAPKTSIETKPDETTNTEEPMSIIDRMLASGKISTEEAAQLKQAL